MLFKKIDIIKFQKKLIACWLVYHPRLQDFDKITVTVILGVFLLLERDTSCFY